MYDWIYKLRPFIEKEISKEFYQYPATTNELDALEKILEIELPKSYRGFFKICGGAKLSSLALFSVIQVLDFTKEWGFKPWSGKIELDYKKGQVKDYYSNKPLHLLVFARMDSLNYCFDTSQLIDGEYNICVYEAENEIEETLRVYSKSFDRFIQDEIKELSDWWEMPESWYTKEDFLEKIDTLGRLRNS